ncbi:MAG TPA: FGGY family carbohydrate kinase [Anaerohalosphaeraceae bacterium]|nr:FGGY family carbohydrate kinase [Anaerohalosphaeraceae bacterium]
MYLLGYDSGTSSIKATLFESQSGKIAASAASPKQEMAIEAPRPGWAQQNPEDWWNNLKAATAEVLQKSGVPPSGIKAIGITYQMHGLVCIDREKQVIRPAIIWCDSRAVEIGQKAAHQLGPEWCLKELLNYPGNFTASKLKWVMENEPDNYKKIWKILLPGDWLAMKMTGRAVTTASGLSEMILWNFHKNAPADFVMDYFGFQSNVLPELVPTFGVQGELTQEAAAEMGLKAGTPVTYRAGDQPNNALSLNVLEPGQIAATAGTSGVIYGISDQPAFDPKSRVNVFLHVNNSPQQIRNGVLLCINGTGILNSWLKHTIAAGRDYPEMNALAGQVPIGSEGLVILPYGNGAERTLENRNLGASIHNLNLNRHRLEHVLRAGQEGIVFALNYGLEIMREMGIRIDTVRAGKANLFLSPVFSQTFASLTGAMVELYNTDGSQGAARGAGIGAGIYKSFAEAFQTLKKIETIEPNSAQAELCRQAYAVWFNILQKQLG